MSNRPIILDYARNRRNESPVSFFYDYQQDINVISTAQGRIPFIETPASYISSHTQTRVDRESDDEEYSCAELFTKTEASRESDDDSSCWCELLTKTDVHREQDDESRLSLAELISKTFVDRERDDEDDFAYYQ